MIQSLNFSSVRGKIRYLLMEIDSTRVEKPMERMLALRAQMPGVKFLLWCNRPDIQERAAQYLTARSVTSSMQAFDASVVDDGQDCILVCENFSGVNPWIRDAFMPITGNGDQYWLLDTVDEDGSDQGWALRFAQMQPVSGIRFQVLGVSDEHSANLGIAGGDVLMDGKWVFMGKHSPVFEQLLQTYFPGVQVILLNEKAAHDELYHLDLFMSLTGTVQNERYVVLVGRCVALAPEFEPAAKRLNECLDQIANKLSATYSFEVLRNSIPLENNLYAYNNCILEVTDRKKTVWLPAYTFDQPGRQELLQLENENENIWRRLGFDPILVSASFSDLHGVKAGLHCITNELRQFHGAA